MVDPAIVPSGQVALQRLPLRNQIVRKRAAGLDEPPETHCGSLLTACSMLRSILIVASWRTIQESATDATQSRGRKVLPPPTEQEQQLSSIAVPARTAHPSAEDVLHGLGAGEQFRFAPHVEAQLVEDARIRVGPQSNVFPQPVRIERR